MKFFTRRKSIQDWTKELETQSLVAVAIENVVFADRKWEIMKKINSTHQLNINFQQKL